LSVKLNIMKKGLHDVITDLMAYADVSTPEKLARFVLDHRQTAIFQVFPSTKFLYGVTDKSVDGSISLEKFSSEDKKLVYYTFGLKLKHPSDDTYNTDYVAIIGMTGYTVMEKTDAKSVFEFTRDTKANSNDEKLLLKTIEVLCK